MQFSLSSYLAASQNNKRYDVTRLALSISALFRLLAAWVRMGCV